MKKYQKYLLVAMCIVAVAFSAGTFIKTNAAAPLVAAVSGGAQPVDLTYAAEKAVPAVVHVRFVQNSKTQTVEVQDPFGDFFDPFGFFGQGNGGTQKRKVQTPKKEGIGSGVIISSDGYIVTNNHVVSGADELTVTLTDNREFSARIVGTDKTTDLALIKIDGSNLPALPIGNSDDLKVGEWVIAVGCPLDLNSTVTAGIVSAKARTLGQNGVESFIQTDAAINQGNSGGALVNTKGELVGINDMIVSQTGGNVGYGFAIPTTLMNKVIDDLKKYGTVQRAVLGIQGSDLHNYIDQQKAQGKEVADYGTVNGIYVAKVVDGSAGAEIELKEGDVITAVDGKTVDKMSQLQEIIFNKRPGEKVSITYLRDKKKYTKTATLKNEQGNVGVIKTADLDVLGGNFRPVTAQQKSSLHISNGLEVIKVNSGTLKEAGISKGFIILEVNNTSVATIDDLQTAVKDASTSDDPVLYIKGIWPTGKKDYFAVQLNK